MASISINGPVTCKQGEQAVTVKYFDSGDCVATFSVADLEYVYTKKSEESFGQFYRVEVRGKAAEIAAERLVRGSRVGVHGQFVQRKYNDKIYFDIKNARVSYLDPRTQSQNTQNEPSEEEVPF